MENVYDSWPMLYFGLCIEVAKKSKDRSTRLGAFIVGENNEPISFGFNGFPRGVNDREERYHERPMKYMVTEHAERNAIYNAARHGAKLEGSTMYIPFYPTPCADCARGVIQVGIKRIVGTNIKFTGKGKQWDESLAVADEMLRQAGIIQEVIEVPSYLDIRNIQP